LRIVYGIWTRKNVARKREERVVCSRHLTAPAQSRPQSTGTAPGVPSDAGAAPQDPRARGPGLEQARCA
jgi:hypothetical protein